MQGHGARVTASFLGLGRKSSVGGRRHGKGQLGSGGLAGGLNFPPRDWEADKGFKTAVTAWGWAFGECSEICSVSPPSLTLFPRSLYFSVDMLSFVSSRLV